MRASVAAVAVLLAIAGCADSDAGSGSRRLIADRIVVMADGSIAVAGIAATGRGELECRVGGAAVRDFFVARISPRGKLIRTDVIGEERLEQCGSLVIDARQGPGARVDVIAWARTPVPGTTHGPVGLAFEADGSTEHGVNTAQRLMDHPFAFAETSIPGGGSARMWAPGYDDWLQLEVRRPDRPVVRATSRALPANATVYENWEFWYSLSADSTGVYGLGPHIRGNESPYFFPIFRHRLDGSLDRGFGGDGVVLAHPPGLRHYVTTQVTADSEGRALAVGGGKTGAHRITYVMRFRRDGRLDDSFGDAGVVQLRLGRATESLDAGTRAALGVLTDGRIAVAGGIPARGSTLWLLGPDGALDRGFGRNGRLVLTPT